MNKKNNRRRSTPLCKSLLESLKVLLIFFNLFSFMPFKNQIPWFFTWEIIKMFLNRGFQNIQMFTHNPYHLWTCVAFPWKKIAWITVLLALLVHSFAKTLQKHAKTDKPYMLERWNVKHHNLSFNTKWFREFQIK